MLDYMKKPCDMCPFRRDVDFRFSTERATEFAYMTQNPYNTFPCHKTADEFEDDEGYSTGYVHGEKSKECAGFLTMQVNYCKKAPKGFKPSELAYDDAWEMIDRYEEQNYEEDN